MPNSIRLGRLLLGFAMIADAGTPQFPAQPTRFNLPNHLDFHPQTIEVE
jgi:hypothetical protein